MNSLSNIILNSYKIEPLSQLKKELVYINKVLEKIFTLSSLTISEDSSEKLYFNSSLISLINKGNKNFLVTYIINITFLRANTMIHVSDSKGNVKLFYTAGSVNLSGKHKRRRIVAVFRILKLLYKRASFLYGKSIAVHLNNVKKRHKFIIIKRLRQKFFVKVVRDFNQVPYNGCRKAKIRRKKFKKKFI